MKKGYGFLCYFERQSKDDYEFTVGGVTYYVDAKVKEENYFITFAAIEELEMERKKNLALKKVIADLLSEKF